MSAFEKSWAVLKNIMPTSPDDPMGARAIDSMFCQQCKQGLNPGSPTCDKCGAPSGMSMRNVMRDGTLHSPGQQSMIDRATEALRSQKREGQ